MKTISDLENMKRQKCLPFENAYDYLMITLEDFYVAKSDGISRIKNELSDWDSESRQVIIENLIRNISDTLHDFDPEELRALI